MLEGTALETFQNQQSFSLLLLHHHSEYSITFLNISLLSSPRSSDEIDVTTVSQNPPIDYDAVKSLQLMEECERFAIFARVPRPEESLNDWEEAIPKYENFS